MLFSNYVLLNRQLRGFCKSFVHFNRFSRESLRERLRKQDIKQFAKTKVHQPPYASDAIPVRPASDLLKAFGFTVGVGAAAFGIAAVADWKRKEHSFRFSGFTFDSRTGLPIANFTGLNSTKQGFWEQLTDGDKCALFLLCANAAVFALWKVKIFDKFMWRYFSNSFASKSLCLPMLLSMFSHQSLIHLGLNMYVVWSFTNVTVNNFLGPCQFWALYVTGGVFSSFVSLAHKAITRSPTRALGASGAILALLGYTCMKIPDSRLKIVFIPGFDFSAQSAIMSILLFDLAGLVFKFRLFDHAAHLGGTLFGM
ncbi:peptidase, S54 family [Cooperia oncophora]